VSACVALLLSATLGAGCASRRGARPRPFPDPASARASAPSPAAAAIVRDALALTGTPYRAGGADPRGFDCSGLVAYVFGRHGVVLPRTVREQAAAGTPVQSGRLAPGDLLFFATKGAGPSHVAIAIGDGRFVHAPNERGAVRVESLAGGYWGQRFLGARRVDR
jgi:cell wall-associated NlpC family hydrolase